MKKTISLIRVNVYNPNYEKAQKSSIAKYIKNNSLYLDEEIEVDVSIPKDEYRVLEVLKNLDSNYELIVSDLNVLGRTTEGILNILKLLLSKKIRVIAIKQSFDLVDEDDMLTQMVLAVTAQTISLEKNLMSLRTKEALNAKRVEGVNLGKPKGTIQKSKFDEQRGKIEELLRVGLSVRKIAKVLGYNNHIGLNNYVKKREIKQNSLEKSIN